MALVLPSTVEELNLMQNSMDIPSPLYFKAQNKGFDNIVAFAKKYKREVSLPNEVENWNISNIDSYLNFEDGLVSEEFKAIESFEDRLVPEETDLRQRCESFSSMSSSMDDKRFVFSGYGMKTIDTIRVDSGSRCISTDHPYVSPSFYSPLDPEETYQNLDPLLQEVPSIPQIDNIASPLSISSDSNFELSSIHGSFSMPSPMQDTFIPETIPIPTKRPLETIDDDVFMSVHREKRPCHEDIIYQEGRRKNAAAPKNCRKTRKEKQKEMESKVTELEKEGESLKVEVQVLEELIHAHKMQLYAILQKR